MTLNFDMTKILVDGEWIDNRSGDKIDLVNPSDGSSLGQIAKGDAHDIDQAVKSARSAYDKVWEETTALDRGRILMKISQNILKYVDELAELESKDVGKPFTQARNDAIAMARYFEFYGGACDKLHGTTIPYQNGFTVLTERVPFGVTGHIIPWNYPMQIIGRSIGGALAAGNACVLKPAEEACLTALAFGEIAQMSGLPAGVLNIVPGLGAEAGAALSAHPGIDHISFTGSKPVGTLVQQAAAKHVAPATLELGGKSPQVVFKDADLDAALPFLVNAAIQNAGQTCSASSRILVQDEIYDQLSSMMAAEFEKLKVGAALDDHNMGPMISMRQKEIVESYLNVAREDQLEMLAQGHLSNDAPKDGAYVLPTLFGNVPPKHKLAQEEIFGPVQVLIPFKDESDAIEIANGTEFGLVAAVWTENGARQMRMAKKLHAGQVFINNYGAGGGVELPFGGVKASGHGREKGFEALYGFTHSKTIAIKH